MTCSVASTAVGVGAASMVVVDRSPHAADGPEEKVDTQPATCGRVAMTVVVVSAGTDAEGASMAAGDGAPSPSSAGDAVNANRNASWTDKPRMARAFRLMVACLSRFSLLPPSPSFQVEQPRHLRRAL